MKAEKQTKKLTQVELQRLVDEQTVFSLAVLMVDLHVASQVKNKQGLVNAMLKAGVVLRNNPNFVQRFKAAQKAIIEQIQKSTPNDLVGATPTSTVLDRPTPDLTSEQIEEMAADAPPPSEL